jgi:predicted RNase H-like HicB family nuclease
MKTITAVLEKGKDGYGVWFNEVTNVFAFGETVEAAKKDAYSALDFYISSLKEDNKKLPPILQNDWELKFQYDTMALLNYYQGIFTKSALSKITGINASQLSQYANGFKKPRKPQVQRIEKGLHSLANDLRAVHLI